MRRLFAAVSACAVALACVAIAPAADAYAQTSIGAKLGASFANLNVDPDDDSLSGRTGFVGGGFIRFDMGRFGLQAELLSVSKGASFEDAGDEGELSLEYVEIPVLLHVPLGMGTSFAPYVLVGPTIAFEVGCDFDGGAGSVDCDDADLFDRGGTDFGLAGGAGLAFAVGPGAVLLEGRYTWGITDIEETSDAVDVKNRAVYVMLGYSIPLSPRF